MCLIINIDELPKNIFQKIFNITPKIKPFIAKRDIVCYKMYRAMDIPGVVEAPFMKTKHLVGRPQPKIKLIPIKGNSCLSLEHTIIECGYYSFIKNDINIEDIIYPTCDIVIYKCIIPKGSEYYIGNTFGGVRNSYVSNQLIIYGRV